MNILASKSKDRRADWINHTLEVLASDINDGGKHSLNHAKTIVNGNITDLMQSYLNHFACEMTLTCIYVASLLPRKSAGKSKRTQVATEDRAC